MKRKVLIVGEKEVGRLCDQVISGNGYRTESVLRDCASALQPELILAILAVRGEEFESVFVCGNSRLYKEIENSRYNGDVTYINGIPEDM